MDINKIKAGPYQLLAQRWDRQTSKPGQPFEFDRFERGDTIDLTQEEARRLVAAGAAVTPGSIEKAEAEKAAKHLQAMLAQVPDEVRAELLAQYGIGPAEQEESSPPTPPTGLPPIGVTPERPANGASKTAWVEYRATPAGGGHDRAEIEKLTREQLVALDPPSTPA